MPPYPLDLGRPRENMAPRHSLQLAPYVGVVVLEQTAHASLQAVNYGFILSIESFMASRLKWPSALLLSSLMSLDPSENPLLSVSFPPVCTPIWRQRCRESH